MAVPTQLSQISRTASSNSPAGSEVPTNSDDFHRAIQALFMQGLSAGSDVASASSVTVPADCQSFNLTGTTTVAALASTNSWDGRIVFIRHAGAHAFTHSSTLYFPDTTSRTFASGDISAWRQRTSGTWDCIALFMSAFSAKTLTVSGAATFASTVLSTVANASGAVQVAPAAGSAIMQAVSADADAFYRATTGTNWSFGADRSPDRFVLAAASTDLSSPIWAVDSTGRLLNVAITQPGFFVYRGSNQTSGLDVIFDTASSAIAFNTGSHYNTSTGEFTAPVAGIYTFSVNVAIVNTSGSSVNRTVTLNHSVSGSIVDLAQTIPNGETIYYNFSATVEMAASEVVKVTTSGGFTANVLAVGAQGSNNFSGRLVC